MKKSVEWLEEAKKLDAADPLRRFRERFHFPVIEGRRVVYLTGNSLGLQPITTQQIVTEELEDWRDLGVEGHMSSRRPWYYYHQQFKKPLAMLVGGREHEVVAMNTLSVNLHLMLVSFYRPVPGRSKVIIAAHEFPSDRYAVASHIQMHGFDPKTDLIEIDDLSDDAIVNAIRTHSQSLALVMLSGVHFYSGTFVPIDVITREAHAVGAYAGFDLAHAIGNVDLHLHDWDADFAVWCSYKYLNSGPGGVGGAFVHERFAERRDIPRMAGWWGNDEETRFDMAHDFIPTYGADAWQLSNAQILPMAAHKASLDIFEEAGIAALSSKRDALTGFAERIIDDVLADVSYGSIITPRDKKRRGAQLSIRFTERPREIFDNIIRNGALVDWRTPDVVRIAPAPLYNSFEDVAVFGSILADAIGS